MPDHVVTESAGGLRRPLRMKFTARGLDALRPPAAGRLEAWDNELPGFGVRLTAAGVLTFVVRYRQGPQHRRFSIGNAPPLSLAAARTEARRVLAEVELGRDPSAARAHERQAATFGALAREYLEKHAVKKRTGNTDRRMLDREVLPLWRARAAKNVKRADVIRLLDDIADGRGARRFPGRPAPIQANRVLQLVRKVFNFGIQRDLVEWNPCHMVAPRGVERARDRVLAEDEIRGLWLGLEPEPPWFSGPVRMLLLTAQRRGEVLRMRWPDLAGESRGWVWTIPAEHAKNGRPHRVPLSAPAVAILETMRSLQAAGSPWVFPGKRYGAHITNVELALDRARSRFGLAHFTCHDLRRTAGTFIAGLAGAHGRFVVSRILNHSDSSVTARYDRYSYDVEKRVALEAWGRRVLELAADQERRGADVLPMVR